MDPYRCLDLCGINPVLSGTGTDVNLCLVYILCVTVNEHH